MAAGAVPRIRGQHDLPVPSSTALYYFIVAMPILSYTVYPLYQHFVLHHIPLPSGFNTWQIGSLLNFLPSILLMAWTFGIAIGIVILITALFWGGIGAVLGSMYRRKRIAVHA